MAVATHAAGGADDVADPNTEQRDFWTGQAGPIWVRQAAAMDQTLAPVLEAVFDAAALRPSELVLDVGCGAGTSTIEAARRVSPGGKAIGVDISETLLAAARARKAPGAAFELADAQTHPFEPDHFDSVISRFGVMFFADFEAAFRQLWTSLKPGGRIAFATWGDIPDNPYFTLPARVSKSTLGPMPKTDPDSPGPFALRDPFRIKNILQNADFNEIKVDSQHMMLTPAGNAKDVADLMMEIGPAQAAVSYHASGPDDKARLHAALVESLAQFESHRVVRIPALINIAHARKPA